MGRKSSGKGWELIRAGGNKAPRERVSAAPAEQKIRVKIEKRAKGKRVTLASGFQLSEADLKSLGKRLKATCGAGGKAQDEAIEVQGNHVEKVKSFLEGEGFRVST